MIIAKQYTFHAAHYIPGHKYCGNMHGHTYKLEVSVAGSVCADGMVLDFHLLDEIVKPLVEELDHGVKGVGYPCNNEGLNHTFAIPTAENILLHFWDMINAALTEDDYTGLGLYRIKLWETDKCFVERINNDVKVHEA